jgi:hypothetical protein
MELEMQNEELREAQTDLEASAAHLTDYMISLRSAISRSPPTGSSAGSI